MAVVHQAGDLAQTQFALEQAHLLVGQDIGDRAAFDDHRMRSEGFAGEARAAALAVGKQIEAGGQDLQEELGTVAAAVEDEGDPA